MAVGTVEADAAGAELFRQEGAQLQGRTELHVHGRGEVLFGEERQPGAIYPLVAEVLEKRRS